MSKAPNLMSGQDTREEETAAKEAGWHRNDLSWERLQEQGCEALASGDHATAIRCFGRARWLALWRFQRSDARFATSLANAAMVARLNGRSRRARQLYLRALERWEAVPARIKPVDPGPKPRRSLFPGTFGRRQDEGYPEDRLGHLSTFVAEADATLRALASDREPPYRPFERWPDEKPARFDDARKLLAAALLIAT